MFLFANFIPLPRQFVNHLIQFNLGLPLFNIHLISPNLYYFINLFHLFNAKVFPSIILFLNGFKFNYIFNIFIILFFVLVIISNKISAKSLYLFDFINLGYKFNIFLYMIY